MSHPLCPICHYDFSWRERWRFADSWNRRRVVVCPHCAATLIYIRRAWRIMTVGSLLLLVCAIVRLALMLMGASLAGAVNNMLLILQIIAILGISHGLRHLRLIPIQAP